MFDSIECGGDIQKGRRNGHFLEKRDAQNLQEFVEAAVGGQPLLQDGDEHIHGERAPDLGLHGVLARAMEGLDPEMLCDPLEQLGDILPINSALLKSRSTTASIH